MTRKNERETGPERRKSLPRTVDEDLDSINESELLREEKRTNPKIKRAFLIGAGIISILLLLSFFYLEGPLFGVIQGSIESRSPENNILSLKNISIHFTSQALTALSGLSSPNTQVETSRCLKGTIQGSNYYIDEVYTPVIYDQSFNHVTSEPCSNDTLIMFHTHPYKSCIASSVDLNTLKATQSANPQIIMIIECGKNRFSVYR